MTPKIYFYFFNHPPIWSGIELDNLYEQLKRLGKLIQAAVHGHNIPAASIHTVENVMVKSAAVWIPTTVAYGICFTQKDKAKNISFISLQT